MNENEEIKAISYDILEYYINNIPFVDKITFINKIKMDSKFCNTEIDKEAKTAVIHILESKTDKEIKELINIMTI